MPTMTRRRTRSSTGVVDESTPSTDTATTNVATKGRKSTIAWADKLEALKQYKAEHGHTNVPKSNAKYQGLGRFVNNQRQFYRKYQQGEYSSLTAERIKSLEDVSTYSTYLVGFYVSSIVSHSIFCTSFILHCMKLGFVWSMKPIGEERARAIQSQWDKRIQGEFDPCLANLRFQHL